MSDARGVVVGMSGGVDSGLAAALLHREGLTVHGVTLRLAPGPTGAAAAQAARLGIAHEVLDATLRFEAEVLRPSWEEYARGRTPNPCARCNPAVKLALLLEAADRLGAAWVATGHYARVEPGPLPALRRGRDPRKDQSYFLFALPESALARLLLPLGELTKAAVRRLAAEIDLPGAGRRESQDACVALDAERLPEVLRQRFGAEARPGPILAPDGRALGRHAGFHRFTVGQRHGLGLALGRPAWVQAVRPEEAAVVVTTAREDLLARGLRLAELRLAPRHRGLAEARCLVQVRSQHPAAPARARRLGPDALEVRFDAPQRAVAPGQAAVLYRDDEILGGGWIAAALP